ncbi:MAG: hypothetical protein OXI81_06405 [Paracoccaceae bacterium]|nr:hypothetical protein [Paracoccaceae bacterium]
MLALAVTRGGLPPGYEVFPGNSWEEDSFLSTPRTMHPETAQAVIVADAGLFSQDNLDGLEAQRQEVAGEFRRDRINGVFRAKRR